ncbi:ribose-5-phosphate isomerase RpiA [Oligoflexia bacterium]|nr:ribose-5-phosphate isomerase RpiA [Oligoflexia bacterium]
MAETLKQLVGRELAQRVVDGDTVGVGTGSTVNAALEAIGKRISAEGLTVHAVPTSYQSAWLCQELGLTVLYPGFCSELPWGFDGADEVDERQRLIKGGGGALLQEKILAARCKKYVIVVDESKLVPKLGEKFPVPIEVIPEASWIVENELKNFGATEVLVREARSKAGPVITESGNIIVDALFSEVPDSLEKDLNGIVGIVENGLFINYATEVLVAGEDGIRKLS